ncbi:protelomerase family protein [Klebsiella pneumoniae]|uniref:protelomerase family protein n=1 Tax=Klebsiella pneumoniae TaxID=573 RepID=UPI002265BBFC|nr:protelomerase family protein [Klebsiella pneumoniae]
MIEIMLQGEFSVAGKYTVTFLGQAKKRSEDKGVSRKIYTLCDADLFVSLVNQLRSCPAAADFDEVVKGYGENDTRSENGRINAILATAFNPWVKKFLGDDRRVYKDSRAIYARIAYEMFFRVDPRWRMSMRTFSSWRFSVMTMKTPSCTISSLNCKLLQNLASTCWRGKYPAGSAAKAG